MQVDLSLPKYVDDVAKQIALGPERVRHEGYCSVAMYALASSDDCLYGHAAEGGYVQNLSKQVVMPSFVGGGAQQQLRAFLNHQHKGAVSLGARYFGPTCVCDWHSSS